MTRTWATFLVCSAILATAGIPVAAQEPASSADIVDLNKALSAYHRGDYADAKQLLEGLREKEPENITAMYYLGLIHLKEGLQASIDGNYAEARGAFTDAGAMFETVVRLADPRLLPVEAGLDLGIAKLGSDDPTQPVDDETNRQLAWGAKETLEQYTSQEPGLSDRLGHFFLGMAYYRLHRMNHPGRGHLINAETSLDEAMRLAQADRDSGRIAPEEFAAFETPVKYYQGLMQIERGRLAAARIHLSHVIDIAGGTELASNAENLITYIDKEQRQNPEPMSLDSPIGPLQFEGGFTISQAFDSNVILLGHDTALPRGLGQSEDYQFGLSADFDLTRTIYDDEGLPLGRSLLFGFGATTFNIWQPSIGEFDINTYAARAYINWEPIDDIYLGLQYDYAYTKLGGKPFISSNRITPVITKIWRGPGSEMGNGNGQGGPREERARTDVYYSYEYRDYFDKLTRREFERDGAYHAIGFTQSFKLWRAYQIWKNYYDSTPGKEVADADRWMSLRFGYIYRNERTQGDEFDLFGNTIFFGFEIPLPYRLAFDFAADFTWDDYSQPSRIDFRRNERFDFIQRYNLGLTRTFVAPGDYAPMPSLEVKARLGVEVTYQDSNIWDRLSEDVFSYTRTIYGIQLMVRF